MIPRRSSSSLMCTTSVVVSATLAEKTITMIGEAKMNYRTIGAALNSRQI